jgi:hypothetical protein
MSCMNVGNVCIMYADKTDRTNRIGGKPTPRYVQILGKSQQGVDVTGDRPKSHWRVKSGHKAQTFPGKKKFLGGKSNTDQKSELRFR